MLYVSHFIPLLLLLLPSSSWPGIWCPLRRQLSALLSHRSQVDGDPLPSANRSREYAHVRPKRINIRSPCAGMSHTSKRWRSRTCIRTQTHTWTHTYEYTHTGPLNHGTDDPEAWGWALARFRPNHYNNSCSVCVFVYVWVCVYVCVWVSTYHVIFVRTSYAFRPLKVNTFWMSEDFLSSHCFSDWGSCVCFRVVVRVWFRVYACWRDGLSWS